jgi:hypothetical protein
MDFNVNGLTFTRVSTIEIPECVFHPYSTNSKKLDAMFSENGGLVPSQSVFFTGESGGGKTTFICYYGAEMADCINEDDHQEFEDGSIKNSGPVVLISLEMSDVQIKRLARRIPKLNNLLILKTTDTDYVAWLDKLIDLKPSLVILDSIQKLAEMLADESGLSSNRAKRRSVFSLQKEIAIVFNKFAKITYTPVVLVGHTNKKGQYLGPTGLKHELDSHLEVIIDKQTRERKIKMSKNRWGPELEEITMKFENDTVSFDSGFMDLINTSDLGKINTDSSIQATLISICNSLKIKYKDRLLANKINIEDIKLKFTNTRAFKANIIEGMKNLVIIDIGTRRIDKMNEDTWSRHPDENRYMQLMCKTSKDKIIWMFLHEFYHLFKDGKGHNLLFFQRIHEFSKENQELFSH